MKKKLIIRSTIALAATVCILTSVLGIHVYQVTHKPKPTEPIVQLSRIDFLQPIDSAEALRLRYKVAAMKGIQSTYFNHSANILVYTYLVDQQSSLAVYETLMQSGTYKAKRYIVNQSDLANGCPIAGNNPSISGKATAYLSSLFN